MKITKTYFREMTGCLLGLSLLVYLSFVIRRPVSDIVMFVEDDACYYLQVAKNWVEGWGFTVDRLQPTNGFHPLWMLVLYPIFRCFGDVESAFRAMLVLSFVLVFLSMFVMAVLCRRLQLSFSATLASLAMLAMLVLAVKQPCMAWNRGSPS